MNLYRTDIADAEIVIKKTFVEGFTLVRYRISVITYRLLSDAEPAKNRPEYLVRCDLSGDLPEMMQCRSDINGQQVRGEAGT